MIRIAFLLTVISHDLLHSGVKAQSCNESNIAYVKTVGHIHRSDYDDVRRAPGVSLQECQDLCSSDEDRFGNPYHCKSFNFLLSSSMCILSNYRVDRFKEGSLREAGVDHEDTNHYQKHCLPKISPCHGDSATFSRVPQHVLSGYAHHPTYVSSVEACMEKCLKFKDKDSGKPCTSFMYFYENTHCILNTVTRFDRRDVFVRERYDNTVDYFDNYCIGRWRSWGSWGSCSVTCGSGVVTRTRKCSVPGRCNGEGSETKPCGFLCSTDQGKWAAWSQCSVTCGTGTRTRRQICPRSASTQCRSIKQDEECKEKICPRFEEDGGWNDWGSWTHCNVPCGEGNKYRTRTCTKPTCQGSLVDASECASPRDCTAAEERRYRLGRWMSWSGWSICSSRCGKGSQIRSRPCPMRRNCELSQYIQTRTCYAGSAFCSTTKRPSGPSDALRSGPNEDEYDPWGQWSSCSVMCGGGLKTRTRSCRLMRCTGEDRESSSCNSKPCNSRWGAWSPWTSCSPPCSQGKRARVRLCISGSCPFESKDSQETETCQTSCGKSWGTWDSWTECSATCGSGTRQRKRICSEEEACRGNDKDTKPCNAKKDCPGAEVVTLPPSERSKTGKIGDKEANERFYDCCTKQGITKVCAKATCRYDVTLEESIEAVFDPEIGCKIENINKVNLCATDGNDNTECCRGEKVKGPCLFFCKPPSPSAKKKSEEDIMDCAAFLTPTLQCHRKALKPK